MLRFQTKQKLEEHAQACHTALPPGTLTHSATCPLPTGSIHPSSSILPSPVQSISSQSEKLWLSLISFNIEGLRRNKHYLSHLLSNSRANVIFLQETWLPHSDQNTISNLLPEYSFKTSSSDMFQYPEDIMSNPSHVWHGVAVGWRTEIGSRIQPLESTYERIAGVRMSLSEGSLLLVSFYAPTSGHDEDFLESISSMTEYLRANISTGDKLIIGADSNCSIKSSPRRQLAWKNLCDKFDLKSHAPPLPTFHHHNGSSNSSIDLFAASTTLNLGETIQ